MFEYNSLCRVRIPVDPSSPLGDDFEAMGRVSLPQNDEGFLIACVWDVSEEVQWCADFDFLVCRPATDNGVLLAMRRATEEEVQRIGEYQEAQARSPQHLLMAAVCDDDTAASIAGIDDALALGATFSTGGIEPLYFAASDGRVEVVRHLLARGATIAAEWSTNSRDEPSGNQGDTALHAAAARGDAEILRILLAVDGEQFLEKFGMEAGWRLTALGVAAAGGHAEACRVLLEAGADVNANDTSAVGETALSEAVQNGHAEVVRMLLAAGADPLIPGWMGISAMERAQESGGEILAMVEGWRARS